MTIDARLDARLSRNPDGHLGIKIAEQGVLLPVKLPLLLPLMFVSGPGNDARNESCAWMST